MSNSKTLSEAKTSFVQILNCINQNDMEDFQTFVFEELIKHSNNCEDDNDANDLKRSKMDKSDSIMDDPVYLLNSISSLIKEMLPIDATVSSETILSPKTGENSDCIPDITVHVDEFLYSEEDIENLVEEGRLKSHYCRNCGSKNIEPLIYISHSMSKEALYYIFNTKLPRLDDKIVLDIGSRIGAVLYGAYAYTDAKKIIGVEMNEELCAIQNKIISETLNDRIKVICDRIENQPEVVNTADVVVLNNVFEFYLSVDEHIAAWKFLKKNLRKGAIVVTRPHLETTFKNINTGISIDSWLKPYENPEEMQTPYDDEDENKSAFCDIAFYQVL